MSLEPQIFSGLQPLSQPFVKSSLVEVTDTLAVKPPCRIFFKNEYEQPSGSFKLRGIGNLVSKSYQEAKTKFPHKEIHVYASSGGNAGLAAAYAARYYKVNCTVVLPVVSKPEVIEKLESYGAKTVIHGANIYEADQYLQAILRNIDTKKYHPIYCHPFENPLIWEGHSTLVDEVFQSQLPEEDKPKVKGFVCSVGGGGLYNGIHKGIIRNKSTSDVFLVETNQAPTLHETIKAGKVVTLKSVNSLATSLACSSLSYQSLANYNDQSKVKTHSASIDDLEAIKGSVNFYRNYGVPVEPACGASLSVLYNQLPLLTSKFPNLKSDDIIVVVVCGGSCTNIEGIKKFETLVERQAHKL
ncbi:L-serine dehydratase [Meyerozyma sp. JA9]|nr:L-serine dehydratase [Meyerozyma sp. JA9]